MMTGRIFRFRSLSRMQKVVVLFIIFIVGYCYLPILLRQGGKEEVAMTLVRDRGIHFTSSGKGFVVEGKEKRILSGAVHYFRIPPPYWMDRLTKLKAAGLNTVETTQLVLLTRHPPHQVLHKPTFLRYLFTGYGLQCSLPSYEFSSYMPWNLHEPVPGKFDFTGILDVYRFLTMAQSLHLHVIVRPGPYICSEWEMGGLPAWLLHDPGMILRSSYQPYLTAVQEYFTKVIGILGPLQSAYGGPIIALQIENEYSQYADSNSKDSQDYMKFLYQLLRRLGVVELLFTSESQQELDSSLKLRPADDVLLTVNFMTDRNGLVHLTEIQPDKPVMVMEFWTGWFDYWKEGRLTRNQSPYELATKTAAILEFGASLNYYMFHGGTNFGFMNGANWGDMVVYKPIVTSYDYDAPLSENGDTTIKFTEIRKILGTMALDSVSEFPLPLVPPNIPTTSYGELKLTLYLPIIDSLQYLPEPFISMNTIAMEMLPLHGCGQSYGFVLYRAYISSQTKKITILQLRDYGVALINSVPVQSMSYFSSQNFLIPPSIREQNQDKAMVTLDILVENAGRVNYGHPLESRKGILGGVLADGIKLTDWKIYSLEFLPQFIADINAGGMWQRTLPSMMSPGPALFKGFFTIHNATMDTFLDMEGWEKGVVFVNGANLGRYWNVGPQRTLYVPAPVLKHGVNQVIVFEMYNPRRPQTIMFRNRPILDTTRTTL